MSIKEKKVSQKTSSQRGAVLMIFGAGLLLLLALLAAMFAIGQAYYARAQLRPLASGAATAAVLTLGPSAGCDGMDCSGIARWNVAQTRALDALQGAPYAGFFENGTSLEFSGDPVISSDGVPTWTSTTENASANTSTTEVTIERGRWFKSADGDGNGIYQFESLEPDSWQETHPGLPRVLAFNAARITISRKGLTVPGLGSVSPLKLLDVKEEAIATVQNNIGTPVAPFAVPACALVDEFNEFGKPDINYGTLCMADRIVAPTSRYCPTGAAGDECRGIVPQFDWDPKISGNYQPHSRIEEPDTWEMYAGITKYNPGTSSEDRFCFWGSPRYLDPEDNFSVAGVPCNASSSTTEPEIQDFLRATDTERIATVGDKFCVLETGLTSQASAKILWDRIAPPPLSIANQDNVPFSATDLARTGSVVRNINKSFTSPNQCPATPEEEQTYYNNASGKYAAWPANFWGTHTTESEGTCNSKRSGWGHWSDFNSSTNWKSAYKAENLNPGADAGENFRSLPLWQSWVAIIADTSSGAAACKGIDSSANKDPVLSASHQYEIVGFMRANIYDLDIGEPPPSFPSPKPNSFPYNSTPNPPGNSRWAFDRQDQSTKDCNLVRMRLACDQSQMPVMGAVPAGTPPRLVAQPTAKLKAGH